MARARTNSITSVGAVKKAQPSKASNSNASSASGNIPNKSTAAKKAITKKQQSLDDVFESLLKDVYSAEQQLIKALPEMVRAADSEDLQAAFEYHLQQTKHHAERLEKIFQRLSIDINNSETCEAMAGLIKESKDIIASFSTGPVRDSAMIIGAQKIEHYEVASYGSLCELANILGYSKISSILDLTLTEEDNTEKNLSDIAQDINDEAFYQDNEG